MAADPTLAIVGELQDVLLECLLSGRPLPGMDHPLMFPDLAYITSGTAANLVTDHYHGGLSRMSVRPEEEMSGIIDGKTGYARFQPVVQLEWPLTLRFQVLVPFPDIEPLVVGEVIATFEPLDDDTGTQRWTVTEPTHVLAT